jgi:hypothetical protein
MIVDEKTVKDAIFWKTMFWFFVPPLLISVMVLTHYVHQHQGHIRNNVQVQLRGN